jgi:hypothetical protein
MWFYARQHHEIWASTDPLISAQLCGVGFGTSAQVNGEHRVVGFATEQEEPKNSFE